MAKRLFTTQGLNFTASAHGAQATGGGYMALIGTAAAQVTDILEVMITGKASASVILATNLARQGTAGTGGAVTLAAAHSDGPMHPATAALGSPVTVAVDYTTNEVIPSSTTTDAKLNLGMNGFGGIVRWNAAPTQQFTITTTTVPAAGCILWNSSTASGATSLGDAHIIYESF